MDVVLGHLIFVDNSESPNFAHAKYTSRNMYYNCYIIYLFVRIFKDFHVFFIFVILEIIVRLHSFSC